MIKFRGVNKGSYPESMVVDDVCSIDWMHDEVFFENGSDVPTSISESLLMQYTGYLDSDGVNVFEGDIVEMYYSKWIGQIVKSGCSFKIRVNDYSVLTDLESTQVKIVGNIHENSGLLK